MNENLNTLTQELAMNIIANSGEAKGLAFSALGIMRKEKNVQKALDKLKEANQYIHKAHLSQTELLTMNANGQNIDLDVLLIHSQDHLMTTMMAAELIEELILLLSEK